MNEVITVNKNNIKKKTNNGSSRFVKFIIFLTFIIIHNYINKMINKMIYLQVTLFIKTTCI